MGLENTGRSIAHLRKKAGLTQKELADYLGISDKAVSKWERGLTLPDISFFEQLSTILDTDADTLLAGALAHNGEWTGILLLTESSGHNEPGIDTIIYDKPMIYYLLSHFMLAGIRSVHVCCSPSEAEFMSSKLEDGKRFGINLTYHNDKNVKPPNTNIMLVSGRRLLYGRGLTRCFKLVMTRRNQFTVLSLMRENRNDSCRIDFDLTARVTRVGRKQHKHKNFAHYYIPFLFIPKDLAGLVLPVNMKNFDEMLSDLAMKNLLYTEVLDRGFLDFSFDSWESVSDASIFVRLVQNRSGMSLCSLEEIAWRRGFIPEKNPEIK